MIILSFTVLVAHNGFSYDVPLLLAEIDRRSNNLTTSALIEENICFADTLQYLKQVNILSECRTCNQYMIVHEG